MPRRTAHPLLYRPRIRPVAQHLQIMIRFNDQNVASPQVIFYIRQEPSKIGRDRDLDPLRLKGEAHRIDRIMRNGEWSNPDIANAKAVSRRKEFQTLQLRTLAGVVAHR